MMRRCSVIRMPLAAHRASIFLLSELRLSAVATISSLLGSPHLSSSKVAAQHQRGGSLGSVRLIVIRASRYFMETGTVIKPHGRLIVLVDFQKNATRAKSRQPSHMQV